MIWLPSVRPGLLCVARFCNMRGILDRVCGGVGVEELFSVSVMAGSLALSISGGISGDMVVEGIVCDECVDGSGRSLSLRTAGVIDGTGFETGARDDSGVPADGVIDGCGIM